MAYKALQFLLYYTQLIWLYSLCNNVLAINLAKQPSGLCDRRLLSASKKVENVTFVITFVI